MIRGTTPILKFSLPFEANNLQEVWITFSQGGVEILNKTLQDCEVDGNNLILPLSQNDTLQIDGGDVVKIQIRCKDVADNALASNVVVQYMGDILKDGVI